MEIDEKQITCLQNLAKNTAIACGICSDKFYNDTLAGKEQGSVVRINAHNGVILACKQHQIFDYVLSMYCKDANHGNAAIQRRYFYNKETTFEDFAIQSGFVNEKKLFLEAELKSFRPVLSK